jgi:hypothetical protein
MRLCLLFICVAASAHARPVSFLGSKMLMSQAQPMMVMASADATIFRRLSIGANYQWLLRKNETIQLGSLEANVLLFRHNADDWQANAFLTANAGVLFDDVVPRFGGVASVELDAESRHLYGLVTARYLSDFKGLNDFQLMARFGVAPLEGEFEDLIPWVIVQYQYMPSFANPHVITPLVRLMYQSFLCEVGISIRGEPMFNFSVEI